MLKPLRGHPLLVDTAEVLVDAARYIAVMLIVLVLLGQFAKVGNPTARSIAANSARSRCAPGRLEPDQGGSLRGRVFGTVAWRPGAGHGGRMETVDLHMPQIEVMRWRGWRALSESSFRRRHIRPTTGDYRRRTHSSPRTQKGCSERRRRGMSATGLETFDTTLHKTNRWLKELMQELAWDDRHKAYVALRATLHALRDRLTVEEVAQLGAQLPMLIRGFYYEAWDPTGKPVKERHREQFLARIRQQFRGDESIDPQAVARAAFKLLAARITEGEIEDVKHVMPAEIRDLWP